MHVLIIGGTGQISTSLTWKLAGDGHNVTIFNRGERRVPLPETVRIVQGDREDRTALEAVARQRAFDAVFDFICWNPDHARADVAAFTGRCGQFIYISTAWVYGPPRSFPMAEDHPCVPVDGYGKNKLAAEEVFRDALQRQAFPATIMRFHATYNDYSAWPSLLQDDPTVPYRILNRRPLLIHDRGVLPTHFLHADDAAVALAGVISRPEQTRYETFNIVGESIAWKDVFDGLGRVLGEPPLYAPLPAEYIIERFPERTWPLRGVHQFAMTLSNRKLIAVVPEFTITISTQDGLRRRQELPDAIGRPETQTDPAPDLTAEIDAAIDAWNHQRGVGRTDHHAKMTEIDPEAEELLERLEELSAIIQGGHGGGPGGGPPGGGGG